jgi:hypothetical protein
MSYRTCMGFWLESQAAAYGRLRLFFTPTSRRSSYFPRPSARRLPEGLLPGFRLEVRDVDQYPLYLETADCQYRLRRSRMAGTRRLFAFAIRS